jgi:hypothetical protein
MACPPLQGTREQRMVILISQLPQIRVIQRKKSKLWFFDSLEFVGVVFKFFSENSEREWTFIDEATLAS